MEDLDQWEVKIEEPVHTNYKGIDVDKLTTWTQGPVMLQCLNLLESFDLESMSYNTARYIHALYQVMNLAYADRDFYYGDPYFPPEEPIEGLLSKAYARRRLLEIDWTRNDPLVAPGNPYPYEDKSHPFPDLLKNWAFNPQPPGKNPGQETALSEAEYQKSFLAGTTSIQAADIEGWAVSITPSGGWIPACIAGETGIGMSQRMQSFVMSRTQNPFNVLTPGQRPRVTLTPSLALKEDRPLLCFSMQGGDMQDQSLLQFFLNVVEFGMTVQEASEAANFTSYQLRSSFGRHDTKPGRLTLNSQVPPWVQKKLIRMGYRIDIRDKTAGPITAIFFDWEKESLWGGVSNDGEDHGIAW
jgi:gamma-glutamyltranspeptidase/glutathione hydrolase